MGVASLIRTAPLSFMHWWATELRSLLPLSLKSTGRQRGPALLLDIRNGSATLSAGRPSKTKMLGRADLDGDLSALAPLRARRYRRWPLIARLAPDLGMKKIIELPIAARNDLGNLLHFELDRLTPFSPNEVCFAWRIIETKSASNLLVVALEMAPKGLVERLVNLAAEQGRIFDRIEIGGDADQQPLNLLSNAIKPESRGRFRHLLPLIVLGLAIAAIWIPVSRQQNLVDQLDHEVITLRSSAEETLTLHQQLDAEMAKAGFLTKAKNTHVSVTELLAELTGLIPDNSYMLQFEFKEGRVHLSGFADKASDLITILDGSDLFTSPTFRAAVTRDPRVGKERFQIAVELAGPPS